MPSSIAVKAVKITIPIPSTDFPWNVVPPPGTPGAKNMTVDLSVEYADGRIDVGLRAPSLQKILAAHEAAPGGFLVLQGKLSFGGSRLAEAGVVYQPPRPSASE
jgi:hypothetical protein